MSLSSYVPLFIILNVISRECVGQVNLFELDGSGGGVQVSGVDSSNSEGSQVVNKLENNRAPTQSQQQPYTNNQMPQRQEGADYELQPQYEQQPPHEPQPEYIPQFRYVPPQFGTQPQYTSHPRYGIPPQNVPKRQYGTQFENVPQNQYATEFQYVLQPQHGTQPQYVLQPQYVPQTQPATETLYVPQTQYATLLLYPWLEYGLPQYRDKEIHIYEEKK